MGVLGLTYRCLTHGHGRHGQDHDIDGAEMVFNIKIVHTLVEHFQRGAELSSMGAVVNHDADDA